MSATHVTHSTTPSASVLYMAFELGGTNGKLAFTVGAGQPPRIRALPARSLVGLVLEIQRAKQRFGLPDDAPVVSGYEAGRDGFWLHRFLTQEGSRTRSSTRPRSRSIAAGAAPSRTGSTPSSWCRC